MIVHLQAYLATHSPTASEKAVHFRECSPVDCLRIYIYIYIVVKNVGGNGDCSNCVIPSIMCDNNCRYYSEEVGHG